jgi:isopenicillin N synthase-like dioxygenase
MLHRLSIRMPEVPPKITPDMPESAATGEFPLIDLGDYVEGVARYQERVARQLQHALENIGFLIVVNHGIPVDLIDRIADQARRFQALPYAKKIKLATRRGNGAGFTGYLPSGEYAIRTSLINDNNQPDINAAFFMDRERAPDDAEALAGKLFREPNKWPADLPGFREFLLRYWEAVESFARGLLPAFAVALDLPPQAFDRAFEDAQCVLRLSHFRPRSTATTNSAWRRTPMQISSRSCRSFLST